MSNIIKIRINFKEREICLLLTDKINIITFDIKKPI